jgi:hypothetical protein
MRANQIESRMSEEVAELVTTSRAITTLKKGTLSGDSISERVQSGEALPPELTKDLEAQIDGNQQPFGQALQAAMAGVSNVAPTPTAQITRTETSGIPAIQSAASPASISPASAAIAPMQIQNVSFERSAAGASLSVSASFGTLGPVGMTISKSESGGFKVVVDPGANALAGQLVRDKTAIQSRLQALGIKVSSLEVAELESSPQQARRNSRRLSTDPDEELIA